jgi:hypothetical protein
MSPNETAADQLDSPAGQTSGGKSVEPPSPPQPKGCWVVPASCVCPPKPPAAPESIDVLIGEQAKLGVAGDKAKAFKTELEAILSKTRSGAEEYTTEKFEALKKSWDDNDQRLAQLLHDITCPFPCWRCVIECHVCPLLEQIRKDEKLLYAWTPSESVQDLPEALYWRERNLEAKQRRFERIKNVLTAWERPASNLEKAIKAVADQIVSVGKGPLPARDPRLLVDVFLRLVPVHLAVAPASGSKIDATFTTFCECTCKCECMCKGTGECECKCATGKPENCCGIDVGKKSLQQRLIGAYPKLVDPADYLVKLNCLVEKHYFPAMTAVADAEAEVRQYENRIKETKARVESALKSFDKDAKAAIPAKVECKDYEKPGTESQTCSSPTA